MSNSLDRKQLNLCQKNKKEMQVEAAEKAAKKVAPVTTAEPEENFDWDAYENDAVVPASEKDALTQNTPRNSF